MANARREIPMWTIVIIALILVFGGLLRAGVIRMPGYPVHAAPQVTVDVANSAAPVPLSNFKNGFASIIDPALPAVVNVSSTHMVKQQAQPDIFQDPFFRQFFGGQMPQQEQPQEQREYSLGSGVIVNPNGYILTNNHVVAGATDVEVLTQNKRQYKAKVIGTDPRTDIAVLKIDATGLPTLTLGDSSKLKVGDLVFAIGDPFGIGETATMGIVSATGRALGGSIEHYEDFIQTDAAINPGNSGGPLVDARGQLVGINTFIISSGDSFAGAGFAIPSQIVKASAEQIIHHGKVEHGYLGISINDVTPANAHFFDLQTASGAIVAQVTPDSPASLGGLRTGDVITGINGQKISNGSDLQVAVSEMPPGTKASLEVVRNGKPVTVDLTVGSYHGGSEVASNNGANEPGGRLGLSVDNLTPQTRQQYDIPDHVHGVVVQNVRPASPADDAGIQPGDVIVQLNRKPVESADEFASAVHQNPSGQDLLMLVWSKGNTSFRIIQPD